MDVDTQVAQWSLLVGFVIPPLLALVQQSAWSSAIKSALTFAVALVVAVPTAYLAGDLTGADWLTAALVILTSAVATYQGFWKPTGIAPTIEGATNVTSGSPSDLGDPPIDEEG